MSLTPEQFNKIALKTDLQDYATKEDILAMKREILGAIEGLATCHKKFDIELTANTGAHDRIQGDIQKIDLRVKKLEAVNI